MPELDSSNTKQSLFHKFVRLGQKIYFADDREQDHATLADIYLDGKGADDAGYLVRGSNNKLIAESGSSTLGIAPDNNGREETNNILSNLQ